MRMSITKFVPGLVAHNLPVEPYVDDYRSTNHESVISLPHSDRGSLSIYIPTRLLFPRRLALTISRCSPTSYGWQPIGMNTSALLVPYEEYLARPSRVGRAIRAVRESKHTAVGLQVRPPALTEWQRRPSVCPVKDADFLMVSQGILQRGTGALALQRAPHHALLTEEPPTTMASEAQQGVAKPVLRPASCVLQPVGCVP